MSLLGRRAGHLFRTFIVATMLACVLLSLPAAARLASDGERMSMALEIANYIHDPYGQSSHPNAFGGTRIGIAAVAIEGSFALADWRAADGSQWGQAAFFHMCDHWNLGPISNGRRITAKDLLGEHFPNPHELVPARLIAELRSLETRHVSLILLPHPSRGC